MHDSAVPAGMPIGSVAAWRGLGLCGQTELCSDAGQTPMPRCAPCTSVYIPLPLQQSTTHAYTHIYYCLHQSPTADINSNRCNSPASPTQIDPDTGSLQHLAAPASLLSNLMHSVLWCSCIHLRAGVHCCRPVCPTTWSSVQTQVHVRAMRCTLP